MNKHVLVLPDDFFEIVHKDLDRRVLAFLIGKDYRGDGFIWWGQARIAKEMGLDRSRVSRSLLRMRKDAHLKPATDGRRKGFQLAERFIVPKKKLPERARPAPKQRTLLLPISGQSKPPSEAALKCAESAQKNRAESAPKAVPKAHTERAESAHRRESRNLRDESPSSNTETVAARESSKTSQAIPFARSARPLSAPEKRNRRLAIMGQFLAEARPAELERFWTEAMKPPAEARAYINAIDAEMIASDWWRRRREAMANRGAACTANGAKKRSRRRSAKARRAA